MRINKPEVQRCIQMSHWAALAPCCTSNSPCQTRKCVPHQEPSSTPLFNLPENGAHWLQPRSILASWYQGFAPGAHVVSRHPRTQSFQSIGAFLVMGMFTYMQWRHSGGSAKALRLGSSLQVVTLRHDFTARCYQQPRHCQSTERQTQRHVPVHAVTVSET